MPQGGVSTAKYPSVCIGIGSCAGAIARSQSNPASGVRVESEWIGRITDRIARAVTGRGGKGATGVARRCISGGDKHFIRGSGQRAAEGFHRDRVSKSPDVIVAAMAECGPVKMAFSRFKNISETSPAHVAALHGLWSVKETALQGGGECLCLLMR